MFYLTKHSTHFIYGREREREMFYLTKHSTHFIYGRERNVLFNEALNTFYLRERERNVLFNDALNTFYGAVGRRIDPSWGGPNELFLVPPSAPRLV